MPGIRHEPVTDDLDHRPVRSAALPLAWAARKLAGRALQAIAIAAAASRDHAAWRRDPRTKPGANRLRETLVGGHRHGTAHFAVFVYFNAGPVPFHVRHALAALSAESVNVVVIANCVGEDARADLLRCCHTLVVRENIGRDFGAYKDGIAYVLATETPRRLLLLNDSIVWVETGARALIAHLAGAGDFACATETSAQHYHAGAFALGFSDAVLRAPAFRDFWSRYRLIDNRRHAIIKGEVELSRVLVKAGFKPKALYSTEALRLRLGEASLDDLRLAFSLLPSWMPESRTGMTQECAGFCRVVQDVEPDAARAIGVDRLIQLVTAASQIHVGGFMFTRWLDMPLVKRDSVYRGLYQLGHFEACLAALAVPDAAEIMADVRQKGSPDGITGWGKVLHAAGLR
jgi:hypothetical protein